MVFCSAIVFTPDGWLPGGFRVENGVFTEIIPGLSEGDGDLQGA